jgi:hypothetical protein
VIGAPSLHNRGAREAVPASDRCALGWELLRQGNRELAQLRVTRGAYKRTARRIQRAMAVVALAAALLGIPMAGTASAAHEPCFWLNHGIPDMGYYAAPAFGDIDGDGDLDAYIGSYIPAYYYGSVQATFFENHGTTTDPALEDDPLNFPEAIDLDSPDLEGLNVVPEIGDIDGDGDQDVLVGDNDGDIIVFRNEGLVNGRPDFNDLQTGTFGLTDVGGDASPALADIDDDGDLDLFVGDNGGDTNFFQNTGTATAPAFAAPVLNPFGLEYQGTSVAPEFGDIDGDGDLDAFLATGYGYTVFFENTGTSAAPAFATGQTSAFGLPEVLALAKIALVDIDGDGDLDAFIGDYYGHTQFNENVGTPTAPNFSNLNFPSLGITAASPEFADIDDDGDLDAFLGDQFGAASFFFENTGTATAPSFASLLDDAVEDAFNLQTLGAHLRLVDIDNDGDLDAFHPDGNVIVFQRNTGSASAPAFDTTQTSPFGLAALPTGGAYPEFGDINGDGDLDLFVGDYNGSIIYFRNSGTAAAPAFAAQQTDPFGLLNIGDNSAPELIDFDGDGDLDMFMGLYVGSTMFFENTGSATSPAFAFPTINPWGIEDIGGPNGDNYAYSNPRIVDIDGDGDLDAFIGGSQYDGLTHFFENECGAGSVGGCPELPEPSCTAGFGGKILVKDENSTEKLIIKFKDGASSVQNDFGNQLLLDEPGKVVCLYNDTPDPGYPNLVVALQVDRSGAPCETRDCWKATGGAPPTGKGFLFNDKNKVQDGIQKIKFTSSDAGKTKLFVKGDVPEEVRGGPSFLDSISYKLQTATSVTIQVGEQGGACFSTTLTDILLADGNQFKAK